MNTYKYVIVRSCAGLKKYRADLNKLSKELISDDTGETVIDKEAKYFTGITSIVGNTFVLALHGNKVIGYMSLTIPKLTTMVIEIQELIVTKEHRRFKVASAIFDHIHNNILKTRKSACIMVSHYTSNKQAAKFYQKIGLVDGTYEMQSRIGHFYRYKG